ncbi:MAG TPA: hypothetical protein VMA53_12280 [Stellaceae bacterium]|nr:hypothetical protein [Stellaceae bacterium]
MGGRSRRRRQRHFISVATSINAAITSKLCNFQRRETVPSIILARMENKDASSIDRASARAAACWQCGAHAIADCAYSLRLVASPGRRLDPLGFHVNHGKDWDEVRVRVPRCRACRSRTQLSLLIVFAGTLASAIALPALQSRFWPRLEAPTWVFESHQGVGTLMTAAGLLLGFVLSMLGISLDREFSGRRSVASYPPVIRLRQEGWHYPVYPAY